MPDITLSDADWTLIEATVRKAMDATLSRSEHAALASLRERLMRRIPHNSQGTELFSVRIPT